MRADLVRNTDGAALVEAALVLPILILVVFGLVELSLFVWERNLAEKAVQLGVRGAIVAAPVAVGPGLTRAESVTYWDDLPPGQSCSLEPAPCRRFTVTCNAAEGCTCAGARCGFTLSRPRLRALWDTMRAVLPGLREENLQVTYATNGLGYVGRPVPVPVDVTVGIVGFSYQAGYLGAVLPASVPIRASATLPGEALASD